MRGLVSAVATVLTLAAPASRLGANCLYIFADDFEAGDVCEWGSGCESVQLRIVEAAAVSASEVEVCFNHPIDPQSLTLGGEQFTFDNGLSATGASAAAGSVLVATTNQTPETIYIVQVAPSLTDLFGSAASGDGNTALFAGFSP